MVALILFIVVLGVLVFVHELGHFWASRASNVKVSEFGLGLPPKAYSYTPEGSEVEYSLNWLPIGGFVKIYGEDYEDLDESDPDYGRAFARASKFSQVFILIGGVAMNFLIAILLFAMAAWSGSLVAVDSVTERDGFYVVQVSPGSPAQVSGLEPGTEVLSISDSSGNQVVGNDLTNESFAKFISESSDEIVLTLSDSSLGSEITIQPESGIIGGDESRKAIGVYADSFKLERSGFIEGINEGVDQAVSATISITKGFGDLISSAFNGQGKETFKSLAGPVGIAQLSAQAYQLGIGQLFSFAAFLSLNLVVLNLLPLPALDGGRILFVLIEAIKGSRLSSKVAGYANIAGFGLLLLLMLAITVQDLVRIF